MRRTVLTITLVLLAACAAPPPESPPAATPSPPPAAEGLTAAQIGLSDVDVTENPVVPASVYQGADPGENELVARPFELSPPRVPHLMADYLPISAEENLCLDCHHREEAGEEIPAVPESHYRDLRVDAEVVGDTVAGARWICTSCHVPLTDAAPLTGNTF